jgi:hypothetical protein
VLLGFAETSLEAFMTDLRSPSPAAEACLCRPYPSSQKGGTLIAEDVSDLAAHERRLLDPDGYRPDGCPRCGAVLHAHDLQARVLHGEAERSTIVRRCRCAKRGLCGAIWKVLPAFLARWLWGSFQRVARGVMVRGSSSAPARTCRRWRRRLASSARALIVALGTALDGVLPHVARSVAMDGSRSDLIGSYRRLRALEATPLWVSQAELAAVVHRLAPGIRLV